MCQNLSQEILKGKSTKSLLHKTYFCSCWLKKYFQKDKGKLFIILLIFSETDEAEFNMILTPEMVKAEFPQIGEEGEEESVKAER